MTKKTLEFLCQINSLLTFCILFCLFFKISLEQKYLNFKKSIIMKKYKDRIRIDSITDWSGLHGKVNRIKCYINGQKGSEK